MLRYYDEQFSKIICGVEQNGSELLLGGSVQLHFGVKKEIYWYFLHAYGGLFGDKGFY